MYISKYWGNYIGDTDDSLNIIEYFADRKKEEISLGEIFSDFGIDKLNGDFKDTEEALMFSHSEGIEVVFYFAVDIIIDLAALLLECKVNGSVRLSDLFEYIEQDCTVKITGTPEEYELINKALKDFIAAPGEYDLSEFSSEEDLSEMAEICEELRKELFE